MYEINQERLARVSCLKKGSHQTADELCLLEAVAFITGLPHSDHPECTDPVLGAYGRVVNDFMTDEERQQLVPLIPKLVGTNVGHEVSLRRAMLLCDATIRQILPITFESIGLTEVANTLRNLDEVKDTASAWSAASAASAAWSAARSAAWSAARSAESAARSAESAARSAAWSAAWSAASAESAESAESAASAAWSVTRRPVVEALLKAFNAAIEVQ